MWTTQKHGVGYHAAEIAGRLHTVAAELTVVATPPRATGTTTGLDQPAGAAPAPKTAETPSAPETAEAPQ